MSKQIGEMLEAQERRFAGCPGWHDCARGVFRSAETLLEQGAKIYACLDGTVIVRPPPVLAVHQEALEALAKPCAALLLQIGRDACEDLPETQPDARAPWRSLS